MTYDLLLCLSMSHDNSYSQTILKSAINIKNVLSCNMIKARLHQRYFEYKRNFKLSLSRFKIEKRQKQREF